jgi:poly [ADP-ribose] polymerase
VKKLAETNRHELVAATSKDNKGVDGGGMDIDLETGMVKTPLGVLTLDAIKEGRVILDRMLPFVQRADTDSKSYITLFDQYLRNIPQFIGYKRGAHVDFINIAAQNSLLDQLETSVDLALQRMKDAEEAAKAPGTKAPEAVKQQSFFECKLRLLDEAIEKAIWERIRKSFFATVNYGHTSSSLKPVRMYEVTIPHMVQAFDADGKKVGNVRELWHGTRVFNILSILKRGFVLPGALTSAQICGAMFDNGVYFSDQSTKSLNYSQGYWDGGSKDNNCYMFRADVAMGKPYIPTGPDNRAASYCKRNGFDSCHAVANRSGVRNDEQIVYRTSQTNIRYLIEFNK